MTRRALPVLLCATVLWLPALGCSDEKPETARDDDTSGDETGSRGDAGQTMRDATTATRSSDAARTTQDADSGRGAANGVDAASARDANAPELRDASNDAAPVPSSDGGARDGAVAEAFQLSSPELTSGMQLANEHRCADMQNENISPPLTWSAGPAGTMSYAVVMRDVTRSQVVLHWLIYDVPAGTTQLPAGVASGYQPAQPAGAKQGPSYKPALGYQGPCAPSNVNTYEFTVYAIDVALLPSLSQSSTGAQIITQIEMHDLASAKFAVTSRAGN